MKQRSRESNRKEDIKEDGEGNLRPHDLYESVLPAGPGDRCPVVKPKRQGSNPHRLDTSTPVSHHNQHKNVNLPYLVLFANLFYLQKGQADSLGSASLREMSSEEEPGLVRVPVQPSQSQKKINLFN